MFTQRVVRVIIQARVSSSRLPGKAMLELAGLPICVLVALRAGTDGHDVVVATSTETDDDCIVDVCRRHGIRTVRGPLDDTLARFVRATDDLQAGDIVVRLTADNIVPDGALITAALAAFDDNGQRYWHASHESLAAPYGVSAEVFTVAQLRRAAAATNDPRDREHVTPWIRRDAGVVENPVSSAAGAGRSTIDNLDDYLVAVRILADVSDAVHMPWQKLAARFIAATATTQAPRDTGSVRGESAVVLGTAQLGMDYGVANLSGMPTARSVHAVLRAAVAHGITHIDTAAAYGESEARIGGFLDTGYRDRLQVMTKVEPLGESTTAAEAVRASVFRSAARLGVVPDAAEGAPALDTVLLHREVDARRTSGAAWDELRRMRDRGVVGRIGVSVQTPDEALRALNLADISVLQLPFNVLDQRWGLAAPALAASDVIVIARSVFLQGLLTSRVPAAEWPPAPQFNAQQILDRLEALAVTHGAEDVPALALAFVRAQTWIDRVVIGCEAADQVDDLVRRLASAPLSPGSVADVTAAVGEIPREIIDPSRWGNATPARDVTEEI